MHGNSSKVDGKLGKAAITGAPAEPAIRVRHHKAAPRRPSSYSPAPLWNTPVLGYNRRFDFTIEDQNIMEAERINALSALLADLTTREAELRRYL
jgi:hypothetical protein